MTSVHQDQQDLPRQWLDDAYADSPVAAIVLDAQLRIIYGNDAARDLLQCPDARLPPTASKLPLRGQSPDTLQAFIHRLRAEPSSPDTWVATLELDSPQALRVECIALPGPQPMHLCRLRPTTPLSADRRVQLITALAAIQRRSQSLEASGQQLVETIENHLQTSVAALWRDSNRRDIRWQAGDATICQMMAQALGADLDSRTDFMTTITGDAIDAICLRLTPTDEATVYLLIDHCTTVTQGAVPSPFWKCLATTVETSLRSIMLMAQNRRRRRRLRAVLEHMPMAVMLFDDRGDVLDLNLRARAMSGRHTWERLGDGHHPYEVLDGQGRPVPEEQWPLLRAVHTGEGCDEEEYILDFGDTQRTVSLSVIPILDDDERITSFLATGRDVTQRTEEERRKDEFLSVASHELRGPLTPLSGFIKMSRAQAESDQTVDPDVLRRAESQVERLQRLIDSLLDMSRLETGKLPIRRSKTDISALVKRIMAPWLEGPQGNRFHLHLPDQPLEADVDPDRIDQVLTNVVDNAIKHGRPTGQIEIALRSDDEHLELIVADEGDGMPQAIIDRVFDPYFFDNRNQSAGTGIGLYISRQIVEDHGGCIGIDSGPGQPTTVTIRLPLQAP